MDVDPIEILSREGDDCGWLVRSAQVSPNVIAGPVLAEVIYHQHADKCNLHALLIPFSDPNAPLP